MRTATGEPATIRGEVDIAFKIGSTIFTHRVLVADIVDEIILGMDVMGTKGIELKLKLGILKINEELVIHGKTGNVIRVILAEDTLITDRCETIVTGYLEGEFNKKDIMMFEPRSQASCYYM